MLKTLTCLTYALCGTFVVSAQSESPLKADLIKTGLYSISGSGGTALLRLTANGLILVDGQLPGAHDDVLAQVRRISDQPVRILITTDGRGRANLPKFIADGTKILGQEEADTHSGTLQLGGVETRLLHVGKARNTVVYFPNLRVLASGSLLTQEATAERATAIADTLKLDFDIAVTSSGRTLARTDVEAVSRTPISTVWPVRPERIY
jgi:hypothetical protein